VSARTVTLRGRRIAESLMLDAATATSTSRTIDQTTGAEIVTSTLVYTGRCKIQSGATQASTPEAGGATLTVQRSEAHFPVGAFVPAVGQVITITAAALDPLLIGRVFRVVALLHKSAATAYRLSIEETVS